MLVALKQETAESLAPLVGLPLKQVRDMLEIPKRLEHGHLAFPVFSLAKQLRQAPPVIAKELAQKFEALALPMVRAVTPVAGYVNFSFYDGYLQNILTEAVFSQGAKLGHSSEGQGQKIVIDYSSPNVAKPMHIGHLRATVIGQAICNLARTQGFDVIGLNHIGDWGVQFGKLAWAYINWGKEYDFQGKPFQSLFDIYVRFHEEAEKNPALDAEGSAMFKKLEQGEPQVTKIWHEFVDISMREYERIYALLGVKHDLVLGESFYNDKMAAVEKALEERGLLVQSEGALVVNLGEDMPPCLIRKSDGASLYATRDLASAIYRHDVLKATRGLYVVGDPQTLHFKQVFAVLKLLGHTWVDDLVHVSFGYYRFKDGQMSTRKGKVVFLEDVLGRAIESVEKIITEKNPDLADRKHVAEVVGSGAIIFNDLVNDRIKGVDFDWDRVLDFEGDSGPYLQYSYVRCKSLMRKFGREISRKMPADLISPEERELVRELLNYQDVLRASFETQRPNVLAQYLLSVTKAFGHFYHKNRILGEAPEVESSRMTLVFCTSEIVRQGLGLLSIRVPEAM